MVNSPANKISEQERTQRSRITRTRTKQSPKSPTGSSARTADGSIVSAQDPRNPALQPNQTRSFSVAFPNFASKAEAAMTPPLSTKVQSRAPYTSPKLSNVLSGSTPQQQSSALKQTSSPPSRVTISALQRSTSQPVAQEIPISLAASETNTSAAPAGQTIPPQDEVVRDLSISTSNKIQLALGLAATIIFIALSVDLMVADCWRKKDLVNWVKGFTLIGAGTGIVVSIYSLFDKASGNHKGMVNCLYPTCLVSNAISDGGQDSWIFLGEILGSSCLLVVLLVFSMAS